MAWSEVHFPSQNHLCMQNRMKISRLLFRKIYYNMLSFPYHSYGREDRPFDPKLSVQTTPPPQVSTIFLLHYMFQNGYQSLPLTAPL